MVNGHLSLTRPFLINTKFMKILQSDTFYSNVCQCSKSYTTRPNSYKIVPCAQKPTKYTFNMKYNH